MTLIVPYEGCFSVVGCFRRKLCSFFGLILFYFIFGNHWLGFEMMIMMALMMTLTIIMLLPRRSDSE
ncbi:hypothetical protein GQ44DRAFT_715107 [Phaeosphaeriaceae sp. PMI808]|nr:hypothetical protein GQ44DRAFT_715107 [Phaeosphaeriaceae sp. PMI808]